MADLRGSVLERLRGLLSGYGGRLMAQTAINQAMTMLGLKEENLDPLSLERLLEETMRSYRVFCPRDKQSRLWIELGDFYERECAALGKSR